MGLSGVSPGSLLIIFLMLFLMFGKSRIKEIAEELAESIKVFKKSMDDEPSKTDVSPLKQDTQAQSQENKA